MTTGPDRLDFLMHSAGALMEPDFVRLIVRDSPGEESHPVAAGPSRLRLWWRGRMGRFHSASDLKASHERAG